MAATEPAPAAAAGEDFGRSDVAIDVAGTDGFAFSRLSGAVFPTAPEVLESLAAAWPLSLVPGLLDAAFRLSFFSGFSDDRSAFSDPWVFSEPLAFSVLSVAGIDLLRRMAAAGVRCVVDPRLTGADPGGPEAGESSPGTQARLISLLLPLTLRSSDAFAVTISDASKGSGLSGLSASGGGGDNADWLTLLGDG